MSKCPICGKTTANAKCTGCGFDASRDYEAFPTLAMLPAKLPSRKDFARKYLAQTGQIVPPDTVLNKDIPRQQAAPVRQEKKEAPAASPNFIPAVTPNLERERNPQTVKAERVDKDSTGTKETKPGWKLPALAAAALVAAGILFFSLSGGEKDPCTNGHNWNPADCDSPRICKICGETAGTALGHDWIKADCDSPKTCNRCDKTEGSALGHKWVAASCSAPKTCSNCGQTEGIALDHQWERATFVSPMTCSVCHTTQGTSVPLDSLDVTKEISSIKEIFTTVTSQRHDGILRKEELQPSIYAYYDRNNALKSIIIMRGTDGIGSHSSAYSRTYIFDNGLLVFAFYEGSDSHRFYFHNELLIRWKYQSSSGASEYHDLEFSDSYFYWESVVMNEIGSLLGR